MDQAFYKPFNLSYDWFLNMDNNLLYTVYLCLSRTDFGMHKHYLLQGDQREQLKCCYMHLIGEQGKGLAQCKKVYIYKHCVFMALKSITRAAKQIGWLKN